MFSDKIHVILLILIAVEVIKSIIITYRLHKNELLLLNRIYFMYLLYYLILIVVMKILPDYNPIIINPILISVVILPLSFIYRPMISILKT